MVLEHHEEKREERLLCWLGAGVFAAIHKQKNTHQQESARVAYHYSTKKINNSNFTLRALRGGGLYPVVFKANECRRHEFRPPSIKWSRGLLNKKLLLYPRGK